MNNPDLVIFNYLNYVDYLNDWFNEKKALEKTFSYQKLANKLGMKFKSYISMILNGKRKFPKKSINILSEVLGLNIKEGKYLESLIFYQDSEDLNEKEKHFESLQNLRPKTAAYQLEKEKHDYFKYWYVPLVREIVTFFDFDEDFQKLGQKLIPSINAKQAKFAYELLINLDLIQKEKQQGTLINNLRKNLYVQTNKEIVIPRESKVLAMRKFQQEIIEQFLYADQNQQIQNDIRRVSTSTFTTSKEGIVQLQQLLEDFNKKVVEIVMEHSHGDEAFQLVTLLYNASKEEK